MNLTVFISSRNNDQVVIDKVAGDSLSDIRLYLRKELEAIKFFDRDFFRIRINEEFAADTTLDSYNQCLEEVRNSDLVISLYSGIAGWALELQNLLLKAGYKVENVAQKIYLLT